MNKQVVCFALLFGAALCTSATFAQNSSQPQTLPGPLASGALQSNQLLPSNRPPSNQRDSNQIYPNHPANNFSQVNRSDLNINQQSVKPKFEFISFKPLEELKRHELIEDLKILDFMVRKSMPIQDARRALGIQVNTVNPKCEITYVEGFGVIMKYHVGFPVAASQHQQAKDQANKVEDKRSDWEKAKDEMENSKNESATFSPNQALNPAASLTNAGYVDFRGSIPFSAAIADQLKNKVAESLTNAGNVKQLDSDEQILVYVYGPKRGSTQRWRQSRLAFRVNMSEVGNDKKIDTDSIEIDGTIIRSELDRITEIYGRFGR